MKYSLNINRTIDNIFDRCAGFSFQCIFFKLINLFAKTLRGVGMGIITAICSLAILFFYDQSLSAELPTISNDQHAGSVSITNYTKNIEHKARADSSSGKTAVKGHLITLKKMIYDDVSIGTEYSSRIINRKNTISPAGFTNAGRLGRQVSELIFFANVQKESLTVTPSFRLGLDEYELERPDTTVGLLGISSTDGWHYGLNLEFANIIPLATNVFVRSTAEIDYSYTAIDAFVETGAGAANISFDELEDERITGEIGLGIGATLPLDNGIILAPFINTTLRYNYITGPITTNAKLASSLTNLGEVLLSSGQEQQGWLLDAGTYIFVNKQTELLITYQGEYFPTSTSHGAAVRLSFKF